MAYLAPLTLRELYYDAIEREINRIFMAVIFAPLVSAMSKYGVKAKEVRNAVTSPLLIAIARGTVWYDNGEFKGQMNAAITRTLRSMGATFNLRSKTFHLALGDVPAEVKIALSQADMKFDAMRSSMLSILDNISVAHVDTVSQTQGHYETTLDHLEAAFQKTIPDQSNIPVDSPASASARLAVDVQLTPAQKRIIAKEWGQNLNIYIKRWAENDILELRQKIQPHVLSGGRAEGLRQMIEENFGVSKRKAKFLARQETALLMSKFQETRYRDIGIQRYRWSDSHDARVRHDHHELNGKVFRFDSPPITNKKTGARNNPGQDYNCRCVAVPLLD